jgi:hypothetical protein
MTIVRTVTMLSLAREALEQCDNNADAAQAHLLRRLRDDGVLLEALVKSAVEYERLEELHS